MRFITQNNCSMIFNILLFTALEDIVMAWNLSSLVISDYRRDVVVLKHAMVFKGSGGKTIKSSGFIVV